MNDKVQQWIMIGVILLLFALFVFLTQSGRIFGQNFYEEQDDDDKYFPPEHIQKDPYGLIGGNADDKT